MFFSPGFKLTLLLTLIIHFASCDIFAQPVTSIGDWFDDAGDPTTLAGALRSSAGIEPITLSNDLTDAWTHWPSETGYTVFSTDGKILTVDLNSYTLSGKPLDLITGAGSLTFSDGTLGSLVDNFGIGVSEDADVTLDVATLQAVSLTFGSETTKGSLRLLNGSVIEARTVELLERGSRLSLAGGASLTATTVNVSRYEAELSVDGAADLTVMNLRISSGGVFSSTGTSNITVNDKLTITGVAVLLYLNDTYGHSRTEFTGNTDLNDDGGNLSFEHLEVSYGAYADFSNMTIRNVDDSDWIVTGTRSIKVDGVFSHSEGGKSYGSELKWNGGALMVDGGTVDITDGGEMSNVGAISVTNSGEIEIDGTFLDATTGQKYRATIQADGDLTVANGTVSVKNGGLLDGLDDILVDSGATLNIIGGDAVSRFSSTVSADGTFTLGGATVGTLIMSGGGKFMGVTGTTIGGTAQAVVDLSGVGSGNDRTMFTATGPLNVANADIDIKGGALWQTVGNATIGQSGETTLDIGGRAGTGDGFSATFQTKDIVLGETGTVKVDITYGGTMTTENAILAKETGSVAEITIDNTYLPGEHRSWTVDGTATDPGFSKGQSFLNVTSGMVDVKGFLSMGSQSYTGGYGHATFAGSGAELHMNGGIFRNQGNDGTDGGNAVGTISIGDGIVSGIVSGSGTIIAGDLFTVNGGLITPGGRWMYNFDRNKDDELTCIGTLNITDRNDVDTLFKGASFQTQLEREGLKYGSLTDDKQTSDRVYVDGDLKIEGLSINISRVLTGGYMLIQADQIVGYSGYALDGTGAITTELNLNGKTLVGNNRIDAQYDHDGDVGTAEIPRMYSKLVNNADNDQIWVHVNTLTDGNVISHWTGNENTTWDMISKNFEAGQTENTEQFLDGDIVIFRGEWMKTEGFINFDPDDQDIDLDTNILKVNVTDSVDYKSNVIVPEVRVYGDYTFQWDGGSIIAYDSALYTTLDQASGYIDPETGLAVGTPSGELIKIGDGTLIINNANEFYGGIHLGGDDPVTGQTGLTGGLIILNNPLGFGTYNSMSGYQERGLVYVHENTTIDVSAIGSIKNRFIIDEGKVLTFHIESGTFKISGNNALSSNAVNEGKGGGIFIGNQGSVVYSGSGGLELTNNQASMGGGIYTELGYLLDIPANISGNYAQSGGGGIYAEKYFEMKDGSAISNNTTNVAGGGIYVGNVGTLGSDSVQFILHGNTVISGNKSGGETGGGVFVEAGREFILSTKKDAGKDFIGGDIWFENNYAKIEFDTDDPTLAIESPDKIRNAIHLSNTASTTGTYAGAKLEISGPYNTYFYDAISGDIGTKVNIQGIFAIWNNPSEAGDNANTEDQLPATQAGTVIFHDDSIFFGDTTVTGGAVFRLETNLENAPAIFGRRGSLAPDAPDGHTNSFELDAVSKITGQGTIAADVIKLDGIVDLDTGIFTKPDGRDGSGSITAAEAKTQGVLNLDGKVELADSAHWYLNLGAGGSTDKIAVTGSAIFDADANPGEKLTLDIDEIVRGKYAIMTTTGGVQNYDRNDAPVYYDDNGTVRDLATTVPTDLSETIYSRLTAVTYVEKNDLYLDIDGRNRHVTLTGNSDWGYNGNWTFDTSNYTPTGTVAGLWEEKDTGPETRVYLNGDMVTIDGAVATTVTLTSNVRPVDLFVTGTNGQDVTIDGGDFGITTFNIDTSKNTITSTILPDGATGTNDYDIDPYTGKLYKSNANTLSFANGGMNTFTEGVEFEVSSGDAGTISFGNVGQLVVGSGRTIDFKDGGTLHYSGDTVGTLHTTASDTTGAAVQIADGKTATFDVSDADGQLNVSGQIRGIGAVDTTTTGAIVKNGVGTLGLASQNTFAGGTTFNAGTIKLGGTTGTAANPNTNLGRYTTPDGVAGLVNVDGTGTKTLDTTAAAFVIQNRFFVSGAGNALTINRGGNGLTIANVDAGANLGGAIYVDASADQLTLTSTGGTLTLSGNTAESGGGIYTAVAGSALTSEHAVTLNSNEATVGAGGGIYSVSAINFGGTTTLGTTAANTGNTSETDGGGIYTDDTAAFAALTAYRNAATTGSGGAVYADDGVTITGTVLLGSNNATGTNNYGNTAGASGGGIYSGGDVSLTGNGAKTIRYNTAGTSGGGVYSGGTVTISGTGTKTISNNAATAGSGGAIYAQNISLSGPANITANSAATGGAFYVDGGLLKLAPTGANHLIHFYANTASTDGSAVFLNNNADIQIGDTAAAAGNVIFNDSIFGTGTSSKFTMLANYTGTVMFTGEKSSTINGTTLIESGTFRITEDTSYGGTGTFTLAYKIPGTNPDGSALINAPFLTGGGELTAAAFHLRGVVAPDENKSTTILSSVPDADRFGTLTFSGSTGAGSAAVTMYGDGNPLSYQYDVHLEPAATWDADGRSDLLDVDGTFTADVNAGKIIVNLHNFGVGKFLLIESDSLVITGGTGDQDVNGIGAANDGAFDITIHDFAKTDRHEVKFFRGNDSITSSDGQTTVPIDGHANQLWLATDFNNLYMYWTGAENAIWDAADNETNGNWFDRQIGGTSSGETHFENRDSVMFADAAFNGATPTNKTITIYKDENVSGVVVTDMVVDTAVTYAFTGEGGITTIGNYAGDVLDDVYGSNASDTAAVPQTLTKRGTGTLTFTNTGTNRFVGGIHIEAGTIGFNLASQLGSVAVDNFDTIYFDDTATISYNHTTTNATLYNNVVIADGEAGIFNVTAANRTLTLAGIIDDPPSGTGDLTKTGLGTLTLTNTANAWQGATTISGGTLKAVGVATLGPVQNGPATRTITNNATLEVEIGTGSQTLSQIIAGTGAVVKSGAGTLTLDQVNSYAGNTTITGTLIAEGIAALGTDAAAKQVLSTTGGTLKLDIDSDDTDKTLDQQLGATGSENLHFMKTGDGTLTISRTNVYTGTTTISEGKIYLTNVAGLGDNAATRTVTMDTDTELEIALAAAGIFNKKLSGAGELTKSGDGVLTLTNVNTFTGGTTLSAGGLILTDASALGTYNSSIASSGRVSVTGTENSSNLSTTLSATGSPTYANHFDIGAGLSWTLNATQTGTLGGFINVSDGGAVTLDAGSTMNLANTAALTFTGNTDANGANDIYLSAGSTLSITGTGNTFFGSGIRGTGTVTKNTTNDTGLTQIGAASSIEGSTEINAGRFRVNNGVTYTNTGDGNEFKLAAGTLEGNGTVTAPTVTITGKISPDADNLSAGTPTVTTTGTDRFGTLTPAGTTINLGSSTQNFSMDYDLGTPNASANRINPTGDLLAVDGTGTVTLYGGVIDFRGTLNTGKYLIVDSSVSIAIFGAAGDKTLDGINDKTDGVLTATLNDNPLTNDTPRYGLAYLFEGVDQKQIWLDVERNTLTMNVGALLTSLTWNTTTADNWRSQQWEAPATGYETVFNDGDYVNFKPTEHQAVSVIAGGVIVSGMTVDSEKDVTFTGGGITGRTQVADDTVITGKFVDTNNDVYVPNVPVDGKLTKKGTGRLILNNANSFEQGTELRQGTIVLGHATALGTYVYSTTSAEGTVFVTGTGTVDLNTADTVQNRFIVEDAETLTITTAQNGTIGGVAGSATTGGAITLGTNSEVNLSNKDAITFSNNSDGTGSNDIYVGTDANLNIKGTGSVFIDSGIAGVGIVAKTNTGITQINANSAFIGTTTVGGGEFHIVTGKTYGNEAAAFTLNAGTLSGSGTVSAKSQVYKGTIAPDASAYTLAQMTPTTVIGTLNLAIDSVDGDTIVFDGFTMFYDPGTAKTLPETSTGINTGDLIRIIDTGSAAAPVGTTLLKGGTIRFNADSLTNGYYLIVDSDVAIDLETGKALDGINDTTDGVLKADLNGAALTPLSPRSLYEFLYGKNAAGIDDARIWLGVSMNSLTMNWSMTDGIWDSTAENWSSLQVNAGNHETKFRDGDFVYFNPTANSEITLAAGTRLVSGMTIGDTGNFNVTFTGEGGIRGRLAKENDETDIVGKYLPGGLGTPTLTPSGKLTKSGTGTLTFANDVGNLFDEGIEIAAGIVAFTRADQIGTGTAGIMFTGTGTLQANASAVLTNNITVEEDEAGTIDPQGFSLTFNTGTVGVENDGTLNLVGTGNQFYNAGIQGAGATLVKSGSGIVQIAETAVFDGTTNVTSGVFRVVDGKQYGGNGSFTLSSGTTLAGNGTISSTGTGNALNGIVSPDGKIFTASDTDAATGNARFATLTFNGTTVFGSTFKFLYDVDSPYAGTDLDDQSTLTTGDLIRLTGGTSYTIADNGIIDLQTAATGSLDVGAYRILSADKAITLSGPATNLSEALVLYRNGTAYYSTVRNTNDFTYANDDKDVWLQIYGNSLNMVWNVSGDSKVWASTGTAENWDSKQGDDSTNLEKIEHVFKNGDYVHFTNAAGDTISIEATGVKVAGMEVDSGSYTFTGSGGISASKTLSETTGKYLTTAVAADKLTPDGLLIKKGAGTLTFANTGGNTFNEGVEIAAGTVAFDNGNQLAVGSGKAITFTETGTLRADADTALASNIAVQTGTGTLDVQGNKLTHTGTVNVGGTGLVLPGTIGSYLFLDGAVSGTASMTQTGAGIVQIGANSNFSGDTTLSAGTFRVAQGISYGTAGSGTFTQNAGILAGGGTIKADTVSISGTISADSDKLDVSKLVVDQRFGALFIEADTTLEDDFRMEYDALADTSQTPHSDLLKVIGGKTLTFGTGTINLVNTEGQLTGSYLVMEADGTILHPDDPDPNVLLTATLNGDVLSHYSVRGTYTFYQKRNGVTNPTGNQIWLDVEKNSLNMTWQETTENNVWTATEGGENWVSKQGNETTPSTIGIKEKVFQNGDYVHFGTMLSGEKSIDVVGAIIISGFDFDSDTDYTFTGTGTIDAYKTHEVIEGKYLTTTDLTQKLTPDGMLRKSGTGTLSFANGANTFHEGIEISGGIIAFTRADQLGDGGNGITFKDDATLRADASGQNLGNKIIIETAKTATIDTQTYSLELSGPISGAGALTKTGDGGAADRLSLTNTGNTYSGTTTVSSGTLHAVSDATGTALGENAFGTAHKVVLENATELELEVASGYVGTLHQQIMQQNLTSGGKLEKVGGGEQILTHADNTYDAGTTVTAGTLTGWYVGSFNGGTITNASALQYDLHATGTANNLITGTGTFTKTQTGGRHDLTLTNQLNDFTGTITVDAGSSTEINKLVAINAASIYGTATATITLATANDQLEIAQAVDGTLRRQMIGSGHFIKSGDGTLTMTGASSFTGGTTLSGGRIILGNETALGTHNGTSKSGQVDMIGDDTSVYSDAAAAQTVANRFVVANNVTGTELRAQNDWTIGNVAGDTNGGAIVLGTGSTMTLHAIGGDMVFTGNTKSGTPNDVTMATDSALTLSGTNNMFFGGGIDGAGTILKTGGGIVQIADTSTFNGTTNVTDGVFRVVNDKVFGGTGSFTLSGGTTLAGNGTVRSMGTGNTIDGIVSPDGKVFTASSVTDPTDVDRFATLNLEGYTVFGASFKFLYDVDSPYTGTDSLDLRSDTVTGDLIDLAGNGSYEISKGAVIDLQTTGSLEIGAYHIFRADESIDLTGATNLNDALVLYRNGMEYYSTARNSAGFVYANGNKDIWLQIHGNSLNMVWNVSGTNNTWSATGSNEHWTSRQGDDSSNLERKEHVFRDGDYVHFVETAGAEIEILGMVKVAGMEVSADNGNYIFTGSGGILSSKDLPETVGKYLTTTVAADKLTPDGKLIKDGSGTLSFRNTGGNTFEEGIDIKAGTVSFNRADQLGTGANGIAFDGAAADQATLRAEASAVPANNVTVKSNRVGTIDPQTHSLTFVTGTVEIANGGTLNLVGAGNLFFDNGVQGTAAVLKKSGTGIVQIGADSVFSGITTQTAGTFRIVQEYSFGTTGSGTFAQIAGTLAGGGTLKAETVTISGIISADTDTLHASKLAVDDEHRFGTLYIDANTTLENGFLMTYDAHVDSSRTPHGDLLKVVNGNTLTFGTGTINLVNTDHRLTGSYLIMEADTTILHPLDGDPDKLLVATLNGSVLSHLSIRGTHTFYQKQDGVLDPNGNQIWLEVEKNSLNMTWQDVTGDNVWTTTGGAENWLSTQGDENLPTPNGLKEKIFQNGDYVHFVTLSDDKEIVVEGPIIVSGFDFDAETDYTFTGTGTIVATLPTYPDGDVIEGKYLNYPDGDPEKLVPDGKLRKNGNGTLKFDNGANTFREGIEISGGILAFTRSGQLGDGGNGITFLENATLRADATGQNLDNRIIIASDKTATIDTQEHHLTLSGVVSGNSITKIGDGRLTVTGTNTYSGLTTISAGTLEAVGVAALGVNDFGKQVLIENGAELEVNIAIDSQTLHKFLTGAGTLEKTGDGELVLSQIDNAYSGGTTVSAGRLTVEHVEHGTNHGGLATGDVEIAKYAVLNFDILEDGSYSKRIFGEGKVEKSGPNTLTLSNPTSSYTGGTEILGGRITATHQNALGRNVATGIVDMSGVDTSLELKIVENATFNQEITGQGELIQTGPGNLTLTNTNSFAGGTRWNGGDIHLTNGAGLSATTGSSKAGFVYVNIGGTLSTAATADTLQNRFEIAADRTLTIANGLTVSGNDVTGADGGAIELKPGAAFTTSGPLHLTNNSTDGHGGAVYAPTEHIVIGGIGTNTVTTLTGNSAVDGGGVYAESVSVKAPIGGSIISGNTASGHGGAFYLVGGSDGSNAVSELDATLGSIALSGNTSSAGANAIHMNECVTLDIKGGYNIYLDDGITSTDGATRGNVINIDLPTTENMNDRALHADSVSDYYGDTHFNSGLLLLYEKSRFGAIASDNVFTQSSDATLAGYGTVSAQNILLGGTVNAGKYTPPPREAEIATLNFEGTTNIGTLGAGQTSMYIDINADYTQKADLMNITGDLKIDGDSRVDFDTFSVGKYLIIRTTDGVTGHTVGGDYYGETSIIDFSTTIAGLNMNPSRFEIVYTLENDEKDIYANLKLNSSYVIWTGANDCHPADSDDWNFVGDSDYDNQWLNDPLYNWHQQIDGGIDYIARFRQDDKVAFIGDDPVELSQDGYMDVRKNIVIVPHETDNDPASDASVARIGDMFVTNAGTYRFTGAGIESSSNADANFEAAGQLYVTGHATAIFANAANNFQRGIVLQNGGVGFNDATQLGTLYVDDPYNDGVAASHGITVEGENSYGILYANADNMELGIVINIDRATSEMVVNTGGNDFGDDTVTGHYTLTLKHADVAGHTDPALGTPSAVNGIYGYGKLVKTGTGTLILADANTYEGGSVVEEGVLAVAADNRLGKSGTSVLLDGGTLRAMENFATDRTIVIGENGGGIEVDENKTLTHIGPLTDLDLSGGIGDLSKTGKGTFVAQNAANDFRGDLYVEEGRFFTENLQTLGFEDGSRILNTWNNGGVRSVLELQLAGEQTLVQQLGGDGEVLKTGAGQLNLGVDSPTFGGYLNVAAGSVYLTGDYGRGDSFRFADGTTLSGYGKLGGNAGILGGGGVFESGSILVPGNVVADNPNENPTSKSIGVAGSVTFASGSLYQVVITQYLDPAFDPDRMRPVSDSLVVSGGTVTIDDGARLDVTIDYWADNLIVFDFSEDTSGTWTIIDASDNGTPNDPAERFLLSEIELPRGIELEHGWNGALYQLWFLGNPAGVFTDIADSNNTRKIGEVLEELITSKDPGTQELIKILSQKDLDDPTIVDVMRQLAGDLRPDSLAMALKMPWRQPFNRLDRDMFPYVPDPCKPVGCRKIHKRYERQFWGEGYGRYGETRSDGNAFSHRVTRAGTVVGVDKQINMYSLFGAALNYSEPRMKQQTGRVELQDVEIGLYNMTKLTADYDMKAYFGYSHQRYELDRHVYIPKGNRYDAVFESFKNKTSGDGFAMSIELLRGFQYNDFLKFTPLLALDYEKVWQNGYTETSTGNGTGMTALRHANSSLERLMMRVGLNVKAEIRDRLDLFGRIQYATQLNSTEYGRSNARFAAAADSSVMDIHGVAVGRDYLNIGIGTEYYFKNRKRATSVYLNYDADFWKRQTTHTGNVGFVHRW